MKITVVAPNEPDRLGPSVPPFRYHLDAVVAYMLAHGRPRIRLVQFSETVYWAVEGSHRLAAAQELGLIPEFVVMTGKFLTSQEYGNDYNAWGEDHLVTPKEFIFNVGRPSGRSYEFDASVLVARSPKTCSGAEAPCQ